MHIYCVLDKTAEKNLTHKDSKRKSWNNVCYLDGERPFDADLEREQTDLDRDLDAERRVLGGLLQSIFRVSISYQQGYPWHLSTAAYLGLLLLL